MVGIIIQEHENIDRAIRRFKKKYERSGILKEVKKRAYFTKPSVKKRMKKSGNSGGKRAGWIGSPASRHLNR